MTTLLSRIVARPILSSLITGTSIGTITYAYNEMKPINMKDVIFNTDKNGIIQSAMINLGDPKFGPYHLWWNTSQPWSNEKFKWYIEFQRRHPLARRVYRKIYLFELPMCETGSHFSLYW